MKHTAASPTDASTPFATADDFLEGFGLAAIGQPLPSSPSAGLQRGHLAGQHARRQAMAEELEHTRALERLRRGPPITVEKAQATLRAFQAGELRR